MFFSKKKDIKKIETVDEVVAYIDKLEKRIEELEARATSIEEESFLFLKKCELIRYNPFNEVGGDQSFSLVLLNGKNDGFIFTSIYTKDGNRIYSKPVRSGISNYQLSEEEEGILKKLVNKES